MEVGMRWVKEAADDPMHQEAKGILNHGLRFLHKGGWVAVVVVVVMVVVVVVVMSGWVVGGWKWCWWWW